MNMKQKINQLITLVFIPILWSACNNVNNIENGDFVVELDDINIEYTVKGNGPVMIAGHLNSGKIGYEMTLKPLEQHFTMVYYSPRGTGNSTAPESLEQYQYEFLVQEIDKLRKHLKQNKIWIFGHSDQSVIALQYAIDYPKNVEGLILTGTHYVEDYETESKLKKQFEQERKQQAWFKQVCNDWDYMVQFGTSTDSLGRDLTYTPIKWWCYDSATSAKVIPIVDEISKAGRRKPINNIQPFNTQEEYDRMEARIFKYQTKLGSVKARILILQGKYDTYNPPVLAEKLNEKLPNSKLVFIDKAGHFPWVEQEQLFFDALFDWLK